MVTQRVTLPQVALPRVALPRVALPRVALCRVALPRVALCRVALCRPAPPRVTLPGIALPRPALPRIALPRPALPRVAPSRMVLSRIALSGLAPRGSAPRRMPLPRMGLPRTAVAAIWAVTLDRLAADDPQALALLTLAAWLGPAPVPLSLVIENPQSLPEPLRTAARRPSGLVEHAAVLRRRGLAMVTADELELHPVPAALLVARTGQDHAQDGGWTAIAVRLLRAAVPDRPAAEPGSRPAWRRLLPHVLAATDPARRLDVVANDVGWLLAQAGGYLAARGRSTAARALLEDANEFDVGARLRAFGGP